MNDRFAWPCRLLMLSLVLSIAAPTALFAARRQRRQHRAAPPAASLSAPRKTMQLTYPATRRGEQTDDYHGTQVADPYRWLEDLDSAETRAWVEAQNKVTFAWLGAGRQRASDPPAADASCGTTSATACRTSEAGRTSTPATTACRTRTPCTSSIGSTASRGCCSIRTRSAPTARSR